MIPVPKLQTSFLLLFVLSAVLAGSARSQTKPHKFDEFIVNQTESYWPFSAADVSRRVDRFINRAKTSRTSRYFVVFYRSRQYTETTQRELINRVYQIKADLIYRAKVKEGNVYSIDGGYRDKDSVEFWIGSSDSARPPMTPSYSNDESFECPEGEIVDDGMNLDVSQPVRFKIYTPSKAELRYKWATSAGKIIFGQNSKGVQIDTMGAKRLTVFAEIIGAPKGCNDTVYGTFDVGLRPFLIDRDDSFMSSELAARFQNFIEVSNNNPTMTPYILAYSSRQSRGAEYNRALLSIKRSSIFLKIDASRIK